MSNPYIGEIRMFGGNFAPAGWAFCDGSLIAISENDALFTLIGTTYGGDGQSTFALPDLRGRLPIHQGQGPGIVQSYAVGETGGVETVTLTTQQIPIHNHAFMASTAIATNPSPSGNVLATSPTISPFVIDVAGPQLVATAVQGTGSNHPHDNMMPFLTVSYIISLYGIFPTQS
ncbi:phage tail protein [Bradyrhizobium sp. AUGA SZCCT0177]|uniref:phage tail protein n=1 Tax=Bradyrhizobium sp. AUGA SZCCT0177 TaxID=2807665 RepID=UPI001BAB36EF|nr:tail fiber protein [Bradyrhizobium sp. AUGA SZCCT0177]MBR1285145.1 phage tail protein [Bradyrhizobium sp. AUGA SZCCT0177]